MLGTTQALTRSLEILHGVGNGAGGNFQSLRLRLLYRQRLIIQRLPDANCWRFEADYPARRQPIAANRPMLKDRKHQIVTAQNPVTRPFFFPVHLLALTGLSQRLADLLTFSQVNDGGGKRITVVGWPELKARDIVVPSAKT